MPPARVALYVASVAGIALCVHGLAFEPPPPWVAVGAVLGYVAFATTGVLVPQFEMFGDVVWRAPPGKKAIALTFDDGPHPETTKRVLEILARGGHRATFFVVGRKARLYPDVVKDIHEAGHALGLHGWDHDRLYSWKAPTAIRLDIERTQQAIADACGVRPTLLRPPIGHVSSRTATAAKKLGVTLVAWSVRARDGLGEPSGERVLRRIERGLTDGAIVALHDASEKGDFEPASVAALPRLLEALDRRGLRTLSVAELIAP